MFWKRILPAPGIGSVFARDRADTLARWRTSRMKMAHILAGGRIGLRNGVRELCRMSSLCTLILCFNSFVSLVCLVPQDEPFVV